uniref:Uncharacterized protein n=1 Tax=Anguilla anguilla TaxID=7936 RepID=A0A0E9PK78_ANGAN
MQKDNEFLITLGKHLLSKLRKCRNGSLVIPPAMIG